MPAPVLPSAQPTDRRMVLVGLLILAAVALLDYLTPRGVNFGLLYMLAVLPVAWASGARAGVLIAVLATVLEGVNGTVGLQPQWPIVAWNALSRIVVLTAMAVIADRLHRRETELRLVDAARHTLLRLLERELPRPLRAIDWFSRVLDESLERGSVDAARKQIAPLRHHVREASFLATDLLSVGTVQNGSLRFGQGDADLRQLANEAAAETVEGGRIAVDLPDDPVIVRCDPDRLRHAIASVLGRCVLAENASVPVLVRVAEADGLMQITSHDALSAEDLELARLLVESCGGQLSVTAGKATRGAIVSIRLPLDMAWLGPEAIERSHPLG